MSEQKEITEFLAKHPSPTYGEVCSKMEATIIINNYQVISHDSAVFQNTLICRRNARVR